VAAGDGSGETRRQVTTTDHPSLGVLLVDDSPSFLRAAKRLIETMPGFHLVGQAESGEQAIRMVEEQSPDLVLIDVRMPEMDGIEATVRICRQRPGTAVVLVSTIDEADMPDRARDCGALAYVAKQRLSAAAMAEFGELAHRG
jgi:DNA-binding NarL/FixJ family response regulator